MSDLRSRAYAQVLDLVSEGEIEGLADGAKSIYLNGTPLQSAGGTFNFENVTYETRSGTNDQTYLGGTSGVESATNVSTEVTKTTSVTRSITNAEVNAVRLTLSVPALYRAKDDGSVVGSSVQIAIDVQSGGGSYNTIITDTIEGKAQSKYQRSYLIKTAGGPLNIRVRRITDDSTDLKLQNKTFWDSYTEIIEAKLRYPNSALVSTRFDAASFQGIPTRAYDLKLKKIQIPSNYNPITRAYTGTWNGTFQTAWSDNPAWVFYDLVTNSRYGLGAYLDASQVDKWALYTIAQYCDQLVPNGFGGTEPRFTCNLYLQSRAEAYKVIQDLASCFRAVAYWASGSLTLAQDAPSDPVALYTQANVVDGLFNYAGSSAKARHTVALVTWNDPSDLYKQKVEYVEDAEGIARYGVIPTEIAAIGCTSRGQANRVGRWLLYSERNEAETVTFQTGIEGAVARPGQIIKVADDARAGVRLGGRVRSATTTAVTLDASVTLGAATWTLMVMLPDGTVASSPVVSAAGQTINLLTALPSAPQAGAQWIMSSSTVEAQTFRVVSCIEQEDGRVEITALAHDPLKYDAIENGLVLQARDITTLDEPLAAPASLTATESLYTYQAEVRSLLSIGWPNVQGAGSYRVLWAKDGGNFNEQVTSLSDFEILNTTPGEYVVRVYSINAFGTQSATYAEVTVNALGKTAPPANVANLAASIDKDIGVTLTWDKVTDLDLDAYEIRQGATWATATVIGQVKATVYTLGYIPPGTQTYLVKALDTSGNYSATEAATTVTLSAPSAVTLTQEVIDNNVLLRWTASTASLTIRHYQVRRGSTWAGATEIGTVAGRFTTYFETVAGTFTYWVAAVDLAGNVGTPTPVTALVSQPPDYQLKLDQNSAFGGTRNNMAAFDGGYLAPTNTTETWEQHFEGSDTATYPNWQFGGTVEGWGAAGATNTWNDGAIVHSSTTGDPQLYSPVVSIAGASFTKVQVMVTRLAGSGWDGSLFYSNASHGLRELGKGFISNPGLAVGESRLLEWDMATMSGQDWTTSTVTSFRIDLGNTAADSFRIEYIRVVPPAGASAVKSRAWLSPQDQINAGFPVYAMPSASTGFYEETVDYGAVLASTKVTVSLSYVTAAGTVTITPTISVRKLVTDPWTNYVGSSSVFVTDFRYVKVRYDFSAPGNDDFITITGLNIRFDAKLKNDAGTGTANAADSGGTTVNFNVSFVDVESITVTPSGTAARIAVYDFVDVANPTSFKVLLFDTAGTRVSGGFSWSAKGV